MCAIGGESGKLAASCIIFAVRVRVGLGVHRRASRALRRAPTMHKLLIAHTTSWVGGN